MGIRCGPWLRVWLICAATMLSTGCLGGTTYYVATTGSDTTGNGSLSSPWATIDHADKQGLVSPGDTVVVQAGTYTSSASPGYVIALRSGTGASPITYKANGAVTLHSTNTDNFGVQISASYVVFDGFTVTGSGCPIGLYGATGTIIRNCRTTSTNWCWKGFVVRSCANCTIHGNVIGPYQTGSCIGLGVDWGASNNSICNNTIYKCSSFGAHIDGANGAFSGNQLRNNIIKDCGSGLYDSANVTHSNNMLHGIASQPFSGTVPGPGDTDGVDPMLVNPDGGNFALQAGSPAIEGGAYTGLPFNGSWPDIGAVESSGTPHTGATGAVSGTVRVQGVALAGASVTAGPRDNCTAATAADGTYTLPSVPTGTVPIKASKAGYTTAQRSVAVTAGATVNGDLNVDFETGRTFYVSPTGSDSADGSIAHPWLTIDHGDQALLLQTGDTVVALAGDYVLSGTSDTIPGLKISRVAGVTYRAEGLVRVRFTNTNAWSIGLEVTAANTVLDGFTFTGEGANGHGLHVYVHDTYGFEMMNCRVSSAKRVWKSVLLRNMRNSFIHNNVIGPISGEAQGPSSGLCEDWPNALGGDRYYNNTLVGIYGWAVDFWGSNDDRTPREFVNNIVKDCLYGIYATDALVHSHNMLHNIIYSLYTYSGGPGAGLGAGQVAQGADETTNVDPMLDSTYHLLPGSPAIDAGLLVGLPFNDAMPDIGAFEAPGEPHSGQYGTVVGRVVDAAGGAALKGVLVRSAIHSVVSTLTDANGEYSLEFPVGPVDIVASIEDYHSATVSVNVATGTQTADIALQPILPVTYYVSTTGNDSNDGLSPGTAWRTIDNGDKKGILRHGDTVAVLAGTYTHAADPAVRISSVGGSRLKPVTYRAQGVVTVRGTSSGCVFEVDGAAHHTVIEGFTIDGSACGLAVRGVTGCEVRGCAISYGPAAAAEGALIVENAFDCYVHNNRIGSLPLSGSRGLVCHNSSGSRFHNNTIADCNGTGVTFSGSNVGAEFRNGIILNCSTGLYFHSTASGVEHSYNMFYGCVHCYAGGAAPGFNERTNLNPMLNASYALLSGSPAVDAGVDVGLSYSGLRPDLGAYESNLTAATATVEGTVTDSASGFAIAGARVRAGLMGGVTTVTDSTGHYSLQTALGSQAISAEHKSHLGATQTVVVVAGTQIVDFQLVPSEGRVYYVSPVGDDSRSGRSPSEAWLSIDNGDRTDVLAPGDTVIVLPGEYRPCSEGVSLGLCAGLPGKPITYLGAGKASVDLNGSGGLRIQGPTGHIVLDGFVVTGSDQPLSIAAATGCEVRNCRISTGLLAPNGLGLAGCADCVIHHNLVGPNPAVSAGVGSRGITAEGGSGNEFWNNTVVDTSSWGVDFVLGGEACVLKNNILYGCAAGICAPAVGLKHSHNIQYGTAQNPYSGGIVQGPGEGVGVDPLFVDVTLGDYRLRTTSEGYPATSPAVDAGAVTRFEFNGPWPDMGAFETGGVPNAGVGTISGTVTDLNGGHPLPGVHVSAGPNHNSWDETASDGAYTIMLPSGIFDVTASRAGYETQVKSVQVAVGVRQLDFQLSGPRTITRLSDLKNVPDGTRVVIAEPMVASCASTTFTSGFYYIQQPDRAAGVRVVPRSGLPAVAGGDLIELTGYVRTSADGERYIDAESIDSKTPGTAPRALGMVNRSLGSVSGLLVRVFGKVTYYSPSYAIIDDGSAVGVRVQFAGLTSPITKLIGNYLVATGVVGRSSGGVTTVFPRANTDLN